MSESNARVDISTNIMACCDRESRRYALGGVLVTETGRAVATNGRALAVASCRVDGSLGQEPVNDDDRTARSGWQLLPASVIKKPTAHKATRVLCNGNVECPANSKYGGYVEGRFPEIASCFPSRPDKPFCVTLDATLLKQVAEALRTPCRQMPVTLVFNSENADAPIGVMSGGNAGVLMPVAGPEGDVSPADLYEQLRKSIADELSETLN